MAAVFTTTEKTTARNAGLFAGLITAFAAFRARRAVYAQTVAELSSLTDRELSDIGISRPMIASVAREAARQV